MRGLEKNYMKRGHSTDRHHDSDSLTIVKCNNLLKNLVESYFENFVRKFMCKVLLKNCVEELDKGKLC